MWKQILKDIRFYLLILAVIIFSAAFLFVLNQYIMPVYTRHDQGLTVPDITKLPLKNARMVLHNEGLRDSIVDRRYNAAYPPNYVIDQTPTSNLIVKPHRLIYLTVNAASTPKVVTPNVVNMSYRNARLQLKNYGLKIGNVTYVSGPFKNTVIHQSIKPGISVAKQTLINLTVSDGLGVNKVPVPKLKGLRLAQAQSKLRNAGLRTGHITYQNSTSKPPLTVISFNPSKDSLLEGTSVDLIIAQRGKSEEAPESGPVFSDTTNNNQQNQIPQQQKPQ